MPTFADSNYPPPREASPLVLREEGIEYGFIGKLQGLKYEYRPDITDRASLEKNFREKFEALNRVRLTDGEFARLLDEIVSSDVFTAAKTLREINAFTRDDGTPLNYTLVNIKDWCKNTFEVVNQLRINTDYSHHRYDVLILINGVPCVQIELKTLGIHPRRAMEQIVEYKHDPGNGYTKTLLCFLQLFIVSNRDSTYYFANNNARHFAFNAEERFLPIYQFADEANKKITHLDDFADTFLVKCTLGETISRYMVLIASEQKLMMMRPYQVYAVRQIVNCIHHDSGNGYIWHTTGSGKTLTSFKASTLLKDNPDIEKCLFVVDRKDLDRQTREEFNKFQEGCVEENTNTAALVRRLLSEDYADKVIVTTIQKLGLALDENSKRNQQRKKNDQPTYKEQLEALKDKRIVFIFDECHRSQFGDNHKAIKAFFPRAQLFGFTGTPMVEAYWLIGQRIVQEEQRGSSRAVYGVRAGLAAPEHHSGGWHLTGTLGSIAAGVAAGKLISLNKQTLTYAMGIAATQAAGMQQNRGTMCKSFHAGKAGANGVLAALLAEKGFDSTQEIMEGAKGFSRIYSKTAALEQLTAGLGASGTPWLIESNGHKPYACGVVLHPLIDAVIALRAKSNIAPADIDEIRLRVHPLAFSITGVVEPSTGLQSKFSLYHSAAVAYVDGNAGILQYTDAKANDPILVALRRKVKPAADASLRKEEAHVSIVAGGVTHEVHVPHASGTVLNPMSDAAMNAKFLANAEPVIGSARAQRVCEMAWALEELPDMRDLIAMLASGPGPA